MTNPPNPTNSVDLRFEDARNGLRSLASKSIHACVTDPPYALGTLHGAAWDSQIAFDKSFWAEVLRVLKPGAWAPVFAATRTCHRVAVAMEDAGFEIFDMLAWMYSSGMPRSQSHAARITKAGGDGNQWDGWGTSLKPAFEPIILARRRREGTVAKNIVEHGVGMLNIEGCKVGDEARFNEAAANKKTGTGPYMAGKYGMPKVAGRATRGRFPANVLIDEATGELAPELSRYFFTSKPTAQERAESNGHPTPKPLALMRELVRLVTPPGGIVLDPFAGSGTTGIAAIHEGMRFVGFENDEAHFKTGMERIALHASNRAA